MNYQGDGWLAFFLAGFVGLGYMYMNDIKEAKGRKSRKVYRMDREDLKAWNGNLKKRWAVDMLAKEDPNWTKFRPGATHRASAHH